MRQVTRYVLPVLIALGAPALLAANPPRSSAAPLLTQTPSITPTVQCIIPTPPADLGHINIAPVTSPWIGQQQVISATWSWLHTLTVTTSSGALLTRTLADAVRTGPHALPQVQITVPLVMGANWLTVTALAQTFNTTGDPSCAYGGDVTTHTTDRDGNPLRIERQLICPPIASIEPRLTVEPVLSATTGYTQVVMAQADFALAQQVTATLHGVTRTAVFVGTPADSTGGWRIPIDLRAAGAAPGLRGPYSVTVAAHFAALGPPECGLGERILEKSVDKNGAPLAITLEPAICPAAAPSRPPRVYPLTSPTGAVTQTIVGERGGLSSRVLVHADTGVYTATFGQTSTWSAPIALVVGVTNTLRVDGIEYADTQCEQIASADTDIANKPLQIFQQAAARIRLPLVMR